VLCCAVLFAFVFLLVIRFWCIHTIIYVLRRLPLFSRHLSPPARRRHAAIAYRVHIVPGPEAYGHGGVGIIMEVLTDNVNRAVAETRSIVNKGGGKMAESGSVLFNFERKGVIVLDCAMDQEEAVFEVAADAGGDDIVPRDDGEEGFAVLTEVADYMVGAPVQVECS
jgi:hypothetical protein